MNISKVIAVCLAVIIGLGFFASWSSKHDAAIAKSADDYTRCIASQYHMTPAEYRLEFGVYPFCK